MLKVNFQDYGYTNARVRAMKAELLSKDFYEELLGLKDFLEVVTTLEETPYRKEIEEWVLRKGETRAIDEALKKNLSRAFQKLNFLVSGKAKEFLGILLSRFDLQNLKTILRGKHLDLSVEEIVKSLIPAGVLEETLLEELAKQPDIKTVTDLLATWGISYARPLTRNLPAYLKNEKLPLLEAALDKEYYPEALKKVKGNSLNATLMREILTVSIDIANIITLFRIQEVNFKEEAEKIKKERERREKEEKEELKVTAEAEVPTRRWRQFLRRIFKISRFSLRGRKRKVSEELTEEEKEKKKLGEIERELKKSFFVPGGKELTEARFLKLADLGEVEAVIKSLEDISYAPVLEKSLAWYLKTGQISTLERALEELVARKGMEMLKINPLSLGVIISYIWAKLNEVVNLRIILIGKSMGMPDKKIREELILV